MIEKSLALLVALLFVAGLSGEQESLQAVNSSDTSDQRDAVKGRLGELGPRRHHKILKELVRLGAHPWAGVYKGLNGQTFVIAPRAGFALYDDHWCNMCVGWKEVGRVRSEEGGMLTLDIELGLHPSMEAKVPPGTYSWKEVRCLVRWDDLMFVIPAWQMEEFCAIATRGYGFPSFPFRHLGGDPLFDASIPSRPPGRPIVPTAYERLIPEHPIECTVLALIEWREVPTAAPGVFQGTFVVDAGGDCGVEPGMYFQTAEVRRYRKWSGGDGRVEQVEPTSSRVIIGFLDQTRTNAEQLVGTRMSTLNPKAAAGN